VIIFWAPLQQFRFDNSNEYAIEQECRVYEWCRSVIGTLSAIELSRDMNEDFEFGVHWTRGLEHCLRRRWTDLSVNEYFIASFTIALPAGGAYYIIDRIFKPTPLLQSNLDNVTLVNRTP
jgi:hypothetical protein